LSYDEQDYVDLNGNKKGETSMKNVVKAQIIGETSAGMIAVMIFENGELVWSHDYFANGATEKHYHEMMKQAREDAEACADWRDYDGCDTDEDDEIVDYTVYDTSWVVAEYVDGEWAAGDELQNDGMAEDFLRHHLDIAKIVGFEDD